MLRVFSCDDRGLYFVHEFGNQVVWFGERPETPNAGSFANVFFGEREADNTVVGPWFDIPKGRTRSSGILRLSVGTDNNSMTRTNEFPESGGFGGRNWQVTTYRRPVSEPFVPARFEGSGIVDLTGVWMGNDGGIYYIRQQGNDLVWFGELFGRFSNVFRCTIPSGLSAGSVVSGSWADVPKGRTGGNGTLGLQIRDAFTLIRQDANGGFGGTRWDRLKGVGSNLRLLTQNTYLMTIPVRLPLRTVERKKPALDERIAPAITMASQYDISTLQEVMGGEATQKAFTRLRTIEWDQTRIDLASDPNRRHRNRETAQVIDARPNRKPTGIAVAKVLDQNHGLGGSFFVLGSFENINISVPIGAFNALLPAVGLPPIPIPFPFNLALRIRVKKLDGGLLIHSKFPIVAVSAFVFSKARGLDEYSSKGVLYAKIRMPGNKHIHVFNTHMQAGYATADHRIRMEQLGEVQQFVQNLSIDTNEPIVFMGDMNVIAPKPENWGSLAGVNPPSSWRGDTTAPVGSADYDQMLSLLPFLSDAWVSRSIPGSRGPGFTYIGKNWINTAPNSPWGDLGNTLADEDDTAPIRVDYMLISRSIFPTNIALVPDAPPSPEPRYTFGNLGRNTISDHLGVEMTIRYPL